MSAVTERSHTQIDTVRSNLISAGQNFDTGCGALQEPFLVLSGCNLTLTFDLVMNSG